MDLCYPAGVIEDALGQGGLPRVDVRRDADVADPFVGKDAGGAWPAAAEEHLENDRDDGKCPAAALFVFLVV